MITRSIVRLTCLAALGMSAPALAQDDAEERLSQACEIVYAKLCKGIPPGPEMVGACNRAKPDLYEKLPAKCITDFQNKVEGYEDVMRENGK